MLAVAWQRLDANRRQLRQQLAAAGQAQGGDADDRGWVGGVRVWVAFGGVRGGAPPPAFWAQDRAQVFEILSAYVRTNSHRPPVGPADGSAATLQVRQADVSAAITVLAHRTVLDGDPPLDLSGSVLPGARLGWARLAQADLRGADLRGAHLTGARVSAEAGWPPGFDWRAAGARLVRAC